MNHRRTISPLFGFSVRVVSVRVLHCARFCAGVEDAAESVQMRHGVRGRGAESSTPRTSSRCVLHTIGRTI